METPLTAREWFDCMEIAVPVLLPVRNDVAHRIELACKVFDEIVAYDRVSLLEVYVAHATNERGDDDAIFAPQRIIGRQGMFAEHVQGGACQASVSNCTQQRDLIQYASPSDVDQECR